MFWLPYISLVVFLLLIIPFVIYGFKKGWVYSLVFSFTLWAVTMVFVGINYSIYKYLWQAYSYLFLEKNIKVEMDLANLSGFYKLQVILLATGIEIILIYPITFLLMFFINKLIRKYFGHKVENINKNEKSIVYRRKIILSRLSGTIILAINSLFSVSLIASAINVITIPYKKSNFATSFNDQIGKIYSLGLSENAESSQIISNFIGNELDKSIASAMKELVAFKSDENPNEDNSFPDVKKIKYFEDNILKFKEIFTNSEATKAIFTSIIKQNNDSVNPLSFDENTAKSSRDSNNNPIGYNKKTATNYLTALETFVEENAIKVSLKKDLIEVLVSQFQKSFIDFSKTIFYYNYKSWLLKKERNTQQLTTRENNLNDHKNKLLIYKNERKTLISLLSALSGQGFFDDYNKDEPLAFPIPVVSRVMPGTGNFKNELDQENAKKIIRDDDEGVKDTKKLIYSNYIKDYYEPQRNIFDQAKLAYDEATNQLATLKQERLSSTSRKDSARESIANSNARITQIENSRKALSTSIKNLKETNTDRQREIDELNKELDSSEKQKQIKEKEDDIQKNNDQIDKFENSLLGKQSDLNSENNNLASLKRDLSNYENDIARLVQEILNQEGIVTNKKKELDREQKAFDPIIANDKAKFQDFQNAKSKFEASDQDYMSQRQKVNDLISDYKMKIDDLDVKNNKIVNFKNVIDTLEDKKVILLFKAPAVKWAKKDDQSIYYFKQLLQFNEAKITQTLKIQEDKKVVFESFKKEIISNYRKFLGG